MSGFCRVQQTIFVTASPNFLTLLQYQRWVLFKFHVNWAFRGKKGLSEWAVPFSLSLTSSGA